MQRVPGPGLEPGRPYGHEILSLARLPVSPSRRAGRSERETGEPVLPRTSFRAGNGTRTRDPNLGKVVLYQLSYSRVHLEYEYTKGTATQVGGPRAQSPDTPSACTANQAVHASRPDRAASPAFAVATPASSTISAATPPCSGAWRNHCSSCSPSGPSSRPISRTRSERWRGIALTVRRYSESVRSSASYSGSHTALALGSSSSDALPTRSTAARSVAFWSRSGAKCRLIAARTAAGSSTERAVSSSSVRRRISSACAAVALACSVNGCATGMLPGVTSLE